MSKSKNENIPDSNYFDATGLPYLEELRQIILKFPPDLMFFYYRGSLEDPSRETHLKIETLKRKEGWIGSVMNLAEIGLMKPPPHSHSKSLHNDLILYKNTNLGKKAYSRWSEYGVFDFLDGIPYEDMNPVEKFSSYLEQHLFLPAPHQCKENHTERREKQEKAIDTQENNSPKEDWSAYNHEFPEGAQGRPMTELEKLQWDQRWARICEAEKRKSERKIKYWGDIPPAEQGINMWSILNSEFYSISEPYIRYYTRFVYNENKVGVLTELILREVRAEYLQEFKELKNKHPQGFMEKFTFLLKERQSNVEVRVRSQIKENISHQANEQKKRLQQLKQRMVMVLYNNIIKYHQNRNPKALITIKERKAF